MTSGLGGPGMWEDKFNILLSAMSGDPSSSLAALGDMNTVEREEGESVETGSAVTEWLSALRLCHESSHTAFSDYISCYYQSIDIQLGRDHTPAML